MTTKVRRGQPAAGTRARSPRQDARRNRAAIVRATVETLRHNPEASVAQIASAAGVGRVTLYGHFESRAALLEAALVDVLERGNAVLAELDLDGEPLESLDALVRSSWMLLDDSRALLAAAQQEMSPGRIRDLHGVVEERVTRLVDRGRREGAFRTDVPAAWLIAVLHALMQAAAEETSAGRLEVEAIPDLMSTSVRAAFAAPRAT